MIKKILLGLMCVNLFLGNKDLEWFVTFTCNFLKGGLSEVGHMAKEIGRASCRERV